MYCCQLMNIETMDSNLSRHFEAHGINENNLKFSDKGT